MSQQNPEPVGEHVATLNVFKEKNGETYITVQSLSGAGHRIARLRDLTPMQLLADMVREAAPKFVNSWGKKPWLTTD